MKEEKVRDILLKYQRKRDNDEYEMEKRKEQIYESIPEIKAIDEEISSVGLNLTKAVLQNTNAKEEIVYKCKEAMESLAKRKKDILLENGIPEDYLEVKYECNKCKDTGFLEGGKKCSCLKQEIINEAYRMSNLNRILDKENFDNFDLNIFSDEIKNGRKLSPRQNMLKILSVCDSFITDFSQDDNYNLLFHGSTGLGKTYMCNCIAKALLDQGYIVIYQTSFRILEILENYKFRKDDDSRINDENYKNLFDCDLLIIDDLGTEFNNSFTSGEIFNIVNTRLISGKKTIISTNLEPIKLAELYSQRTFSRIIGNFRILEFFGDDLRWES
ncbi:ATP-binding protein [Peptacetobacter sp.]|uniref:ATP-binding protein n=1 Tax=Peptacetobacter sp. TaxID=2991975 RepID=UPI00260490D1|nr:ATP-binding protein [Peptacetobacter sp.]